LKRHEIRRQATSAQRQSDFFRRVRTRPRIFALDQVQPLLKIPYFLSPGWLKIDPNFDSLRKNPRFPEAHRRREVVLDDRIDENYPVV
jgi:hypothetical protein